MPTIDIENAIQISPAKLEHAEGIWKMIHQLAIFERAEQEHTVTLEQLQKDLKNGKFHAFVALSVDGGGSKTVVGIAVFYPIYSTWKGHSYYLEDIIVEESLRRQGIGKKLFEAVLDFSKKNGASRLGWQVLEWNEPAINFYKNYGAEMDDDWLTCRIRLK